MRSREDRPLVTRVATLGALPCALIVAIGVSQTVVSDRHAEREPLLTNFPMYSDTYASTAAYDAEHTKVKDFRFFAYQPVTRLDLEVQPENGLPVDQAGVVPLVTVAERHALVRVLTKGMNDDDIKPKLRKEVARVTAGARTVGGTPVSGEVLATGDAHGFDWHHGRFFIRHHNLPVAVLDLRTLKIVRAFD